MHFLDYRSAKALVELQAKEAERRARYGQVIEGARPARPGRLARQARHLVGQLGQFLIKLGGWLKQYDFPEPLPLRGQSQGGG